MTKFQTLKELDQLNFVGTRILYLQFFIIRKQLFIYIHFYNTICGKYSLKLIKL